MDSAAGVSPAEDGAAGVVCWQAHAQPQMHDIDILPQPGVYRRSNEVARIVERVGTSLKEPEETIRALPSGAGQQGGARGLSIGFGQGSG